MADHRKAAKETWSEAQKIYKELHHDVEKLQKEDPEKIDMRHYVALEAIMAKYRFACVKILTVDAEFFSDAVQGPMWQAHSLLNGQYRGTLGKLQTPRTEIARKKLDSQYRQFLKTSFDFYKYYVQQVAAKYELPELTKAARKANLPESQQSQQSEKVTADKIPASLRLGLLYSCVMAIIHIGDLARYRLQIRQNRSSRGSRRESTRNTQREHHELEALNPYDYYDLASQLMPTIGHPYHQKGVIFLDEKNDFEVVFQFFRALAVDKPHQLASQNLDQKLKLLRTGEISQQVQPQDSTSIFSTWFVRLHGHYHGGEPFDRQQAIENEVFSRLEMSLTTGRDTQDTLMKMVLINIAAHHVVTNKLAIKNTQRVAHTAFFVMRLNLRFFGTILRLLIKHLEELKEHQLRWDKTHPDGLASDADDKRLYATQTQRMCMPLVRLYASWLVACRVDLKMASSELQGGATEVCIKFANLLSLLGEIYGGENMKTAPYLLPEDAMARGLLPLADPKQPASCNLGLDQDINVEKMSRDEFEDSNEAWDEDRELLARTLDILFCGYFLTEDNVLSFSLAQLETGALCFNYDAVQPAQLLSDGEGLHVKSHGSVQQIPGAGLDDTCKPLVASRDRTTSNRLRTSQPAQKSLSASAVAEGKVQSTTKGLGQQKQAPEANRRSGRPQAQQSGQSNDPDPSKGSGSRRKGRDGNSQRKQEAKPLSSTQDAGSSVKRQDQPIPAAMQAEPPTKGGLDATDYDFSENTELLNMVNDFLLPPNTSHGKPDAQPLQVPTEPSYGMHSATAEDIFGGKASKSPQGWNSTSTKAFPGLPWNLVYKPTPNGAEGQMTPPQRQVSHASPTRTISQPPGLGDSFGNMLLRDMSTNADYRAHLAGQQQWPQYDSLAPDGSSASHRARLLQAFGQQTSTRSTPSDSRQFSQEYSINQQLPPQQQQQLQQFMHEGGFPGSSDMAFSNPSSVYQGTPRNGMGHSWTEANPYGRAPAHSIQDDPVTLRSQAKASGVSVSDHFASSYNDLIFQSVREEAARENALHKRNG